MNCKIIWRKKGTNRGMVVYVAYGLRLREIREEVWEIPEYGGVASICFVVDTVREDVEFCCVARFYGEWGG